MVSSFALIAVLTHVVSIWLAFTLIFPILVLVLICLRVCIGWSQLEKLEKGLVLALGSVWFSHFLQVLVPETGFDAVWYHLPVLNQIVHSNGLVTSPTLYQLLYPLWSDLTFLPSFIIAREVGTKFTAFGAGLALLFVTYALARKFNSKKWALLVSLTMSAFQVVAWQSASFYIDVCIATWIVAGIWYLVNLPIRKQTSAKADLTNQLAYLTATGILIGLAAGSKHFNLILFVPLFFSVWILRKNVGYAVLASAWAVVIAAPWYVRSYLETQQFLYPAFTHWHDLTASSSKSGALSSETFLFKRVITLPVSLVKIAVVRDYVFPLLSLTPLAVGYLWVKKFLSREIIVLILFGGTEWLIWWLIPPYSTRYALGGFILALIILALTSEKLGHQIQRQTLFITIWVVIICLMMIPRIWVNYRSLVYLATSQTKIQYLGQFLDGNIDTPLRQWYGL